jgi:uncharacterized Tic20 family protein
MTEETNRLPEDTDRVSRLSSPAAGSGAAADAAEGVAPAREAPAVPSAAVPADRDAGDAVVDEYMRRYTPAKAKPREMPRSYSTLRVSDDERMWAAVAHASAWITVLGGLFTGGLFLVISIFIPLIIYFMFRQKSDYVAFHALQAFVLQLVGTVGAFALLIMGGLVWMVGMVIALLAMVILVGFILAPVWGLVGLALMVVVAVMPIAMLLFGTMGAIETYNGRDYRYPYIARWVDRQMAGGYLNVA